MFKSNGGFTLVELIVVIAILAILAGIAVPSYGNYVTKAKEQAAVVEANAIKTAVVAAYAEEGAGATKIKIDGGVIMVDGAALAGDYETNFKVYYPDTVPSDFTAEWDGSAWTITLK